MTVEAGGNQVVGSDPGRILAAYRKIVDGQTGSGAIPPLWDGRAAGRIVEILARVL